MALEPARVGIDVPLAADFDHTHEYKGGERAENAKRNGVPIRAQDSRVAAKADPWGLGASATQKHPNRGLHGEAATLKRSAACPLTGNRRWELPAARTGCGV